MKDIQNHSLLNIYDEIVYEDTALEISAEGAFNQKILLLVSSPSEAELVLLNNMLKACKLTMDDCKLYDTTSGTDSIQLLKSIAPIYVISFGVVMQNEVVHISHKQNIPFEFAGITIILTSDLTTLANDTKLKTELWVNALQPVFIHNK